MTCNFKTRSITLRIQNRIRGYWKVGNKKYNIIKDMTSLLAKFYHAEGYEQQDPSLGATGPCSRWEGMSGSMNLQAVLTVLVTGRVSHVRVVASEMPD